MQEPVEHAAQEPGSRGSRDVWLSAAYDSLIEAGVDAVRILPLGKKVNLSRTSFYWFFKDREALLSALLALWKDKNTGNLVRQADAYAASVVEAVLNVHDCWLNSDLFDSQLEYAIRSWALQSADVTTEIMSADDARVAALARMFLRYGYTHREADVRARAIYLTQIGYISMKTREDLAVRMDRIPDYVKVWTGEIPQAQDLERFVARHAANPLSRRKVASR